MLYGLKSKGGHFYSQILIGGGGKKHLVLFINSRNFIKDFCLSGFDNLNWAQKHLKTSLKVL